MGRHRLCGVECYVSEDFYDTYFTDYDEEVEDPYYDPGMDDGGHEAREREIFGEG